MVRERVMALRSSDNLDEWCSGCRYIDIQGDKCLADAFVETARIWGCQQFRVKPKPKPKYLAVGRRDTSSSRNNWMGR